MIRTFDDKLIRMDISKYSNDRLFYKNLWLKKYNINVTKNTKNDLKKKIKAKMQIK
tara:strand:- start:3035 stop:3202 length:168 start_codon:yes stop_codon:yes gene_type:complete